MKDRLWIFLDECKVPMISGAIGAIIGTVIIRLILG